MNTRTPLLLLGLLAAPAYAHHSFAPHFDIDKPVDISGTVTEYEARNPHSYLHIAAVDENGKTQEYVCESHGVTQLTRNGITPAMLAPGTELRVDGSLSRHSQYMCFFNNVYFPGPKWYRWWDFGNGTMSDLGSHWIDLPFWALKLDHPLTIEATGPAIHPEIAPASMKATYQYGQRGELPPVRLTWYQGTYKPAIWQEAGIPQWPSGVLFVGEKGMLLAQYFKHVLLPEKEFDGAKLPEPTLPRVSSHYAEWIAACKGGKPSLANFEYSGWLTEANHLGNVAFRVGKKLEWDAEKMKATNAPEADVLIRRPYRKGWEL